MFAEKNPEAWSDLLDFLVERIADDILAERASDRVNQQTEEEIDHIVCAH